MAPSNKLYGEERRERLLQWLRQTVEPIPARILAEKTNVSRQVIVQDISLLKAREEPIMATAHGYLYMQEIEPSKPKKVFACRHQPDHTERELNLMVDHGGTVIDVTVEHPIYGQLTGSLMLRNRKDVQSFIRKVKETKAALLSELTDGVHLHTVEADTEEQLQDIRQALEENGFLLSEQE